MKRRLQLKRWPGGSAPGALAAVVLALTLGHSAQAQGSSADDPRAQRQASLAQAGAALRARIASHNATCSSVSSDNAAAVQSCTREQAELNAAIAAYQRDLAALNANQTPAARNGPSANPQNDPDVQRGIDQRQEQEAQQRIEACVRQQEANMTATQRLQDDDLIRRNCTSRAPAVAGVRG